MEAVLLDMPVHLLGTLFQTFLNAAHTLYLLLDATYKTLPLLVLLAHRARSTLLQLTRYINYLLTFLLTYSSAL